MVNILCRHIFNVAKMIIIFLANSEDAKQFTLEILRHLSEQTDNNLDNVLVLHIERAMYPSKN